MKIIILLLAVSLLTGCDAYQDSDKEAYQDGFQDGFQKANQETYQDSDQETYQDGYQDVNQESYPDIPDIDADPVPRPSSGVYDERLGGKEAIAPLEIETEAGADYYVKLQSVVNSDHTMTMYIHGGETISVKVPLGSYVIKYTSGDTWYGEQDELYFGEENFFQADESFNFTNTGNQISGYTITLYQVVDGNLETVPIDKSQF